MLINLHWSTANVTNIVDASQDQPFSVVISKDAKSVIPGDIPPVQHPGHSWKSKEIYPDHTWEQSRTNSLTPMIFLMLETRVTATSTDTIGELDQSVSNTTTLRVTRTGQAVTLLNLSHFEPETTFNREYAIQSMDQLPELVKSAVSSTCSSGKSLSWKVQEGKKGLLIQLVWKTEPVGHSVSGKTTRVGSN